MRVLIGAECFLPAVNGVTNSVLRALEHLDARGHECRVIAPGPGANFYRLSSGTTVPVDRLMAFRPSIYPSLTIGLARRQRIESIIDDFEPDVLHLAAPTLLGAVMERAANRRQIPMVALFQTDLSGFAANYGLAAADRAIWAWLRQVHRRAELTLAPTPTTAARLRSQGFRRVGVWGRGVDHRQFNPTRRSSAFRRSAGVVGSEVLVGYVGRLAAEKQIERLATVSDLSNVKLVIVGDGPDRERLEKRLPSAYFAGFLSGDDLGAAVASLDVFVHTGPHETYCQAVQEAMAAQVAVVAPNSGGPVDLIEHGRTGLLFEPASQTELRNHVAALVASRAERERLGAAAHHDVAARTWTAIGDDLIEHYLDAIRISGREAPAVTAVNANAKTKAA